MRFASPVRTARPTATPAATRAPTNPAPTPAPAADRPWIRPSLSLLLGAGSATASPGAPDPQRLNNSQTLSAVPAPQTGVVLQRARKGSKKANRQERERREAALDRLNRGDPDAYEHLPPKIAKALQQIDAKQPRKSAARRNLEARPQLLAEAKVPSIVEVGAGTGSASSHLRDLVLKRRPDLKEKPSYLATDINPVGGKANFLRDTKAIAPPLARSVALRPAGVSRAKYKKMRAAAVNSQFGVRGRVNANKLEEHFPEHSIEEIIGANAYGNEDVPGASYGLVSDTAAGGTQRDDRFLKSAHKVLKPGGSARLIARSNYLAKEQKLPKSQQLKKTNKYLEPESDDLKDTVNLNYDVTARSIEQPEGVHFYRPDTHPGKKKELGEYNTEFAFQQRSDPGEFAIENEWNDDADNGNADNKNADNKDDEDLERLGVRFDLFE